MEDVFQAGIQHEKLETLKDDIERVDADDEESASSSLKAGRVRTIKLEMGLEDVEQRRAKLERNLAELRKLLDRSREWIGLDDRHFKDALSASLETLGVDGLNPASLEEAAADPARARWSLPLLHERKGADPTWTATLDTLRAPRKRGQSVAEWRSEAPIRPVVFRDPGNLDGEVVHLHSNT